MVKITPILFWEIRKKKQKQKQNKAAHETNQRIYIYLSIYL